MSGYNYPLHASPLEEDEYYFGQMFTTPSAEAQYTFSHHPSHVGPPAQPQQPFLGESSYFVEHPQPSQHPTDLATMLPPAWMTVPTVPSHYPIQSREAVPFPQYTEPMNTGQDMMVEPLFPQPPSRYLFPDEAIISRASRATSFTSSNASSTQSHDAPEASRSVSPNAGEMLKWGYRNDNGTWSCRYQGCSSRSTFNRGCDLRKHYKRHTKSLFCRHEGCPQAVEAGFSSKKDRARHEAKHNPTVECEWKAEGCNRLFSRIDNMVTSLPIRN